MTTFDNRFLKAKDFGERLVKAMVHRNITKYRLAKDCNLSPSTISNWIYGSTTPDKIKIQLVSQYLDVDPDWLINGTGNMNELTGECYFNGSDDIETISQMLGSKDPKIISKILNIPVESAKEKLEDFRITESKEDKLKRKDEKMLAITKSAKHKNTQTNFSNGKYPAKPFIDSSYAICGVPSGFSIAVKADECETISLPLFVDYDFSIRGKGDSMINYDNPERTIMPGDFIACRLWSSRSHIRWGEVYALATVDGVVVKKVMPSEKDNYIKCVSFNEKEGYLPYDLSLEEIQDWAIVVGVVGAKRWN